MKEFLVAYNWVVTHIGYKKVLAENIDEAIEKVQDEEDEFIDEKKGIDFQIIGDEQFPLNVYDEETGEVKEI